MCYRSLVHAAVQLAGCLSLVQYTCQLPWEPCWISLYKHVSNCLGANWYAVTPSGAPQAALHGLLTSQPALCPRWLWRPEARPFLSHKCGLCNFW